MATKAELEAEIRKLKRLNDAYLDQIAWLEQQLRDEVDAGRQFAGGAQFMAERASAGGKESGKVRTDLADATRKLLLQCMDEAYTHTVRLKFETKGYKREAKNDLLDGALKLYLQRAGVDHDCPPTANMLKTTYSKWKDTNL